MMNIKTATRWRFDVLRLSCDITSDEQNTHSESMFFRMPDVEERMTIHVKRLFIGDLADAESVCRQSDELELKQRIHCYTPLSSMLELKKIRSQLFQADSPNYGPEPPILLSCKSASGWSASKCQQT